MSDTAQVESTILGRDIEDKERLCYKPGVVLRNGLAVSSYPRSIDMVVPLFFGASGQPFHLSTAKEG